MVVGRYFSRYRMPRYTVGIENKVAPPDGLNPLAKPTRHQPEPGNAPSGKRRRQWR